MSHLLTERLYAFCPVCGGSDCGYGMNGQHGSLGATPSLPFVPFNMTIPHLPNPDMKDAEIAKLRAERDEARSSEASPAGIGVYRSEIFRLDSLRVDMTRERDELRAALVAARAALKSAVDPVRSWFDGDGEIEPPPTDADIARMAVEELLRDHKSVFVLERQKRGLQADLAAARAALDGEREQWRKDHKSTVEHGDACDNFGNCLECDAYDAKRSSEAKGGGNG